MAADASILVVKERLVETELLERCVSSRRQEREMAFWFCFGKHQQGRGCACVSFIVLEVCTDAQG